MTITLKLSDNFGVRVREIVYNLPYGGICEIETQDTFEDLIMPVVGALVDQQRTKFEEEFGVEEDDKN